jgi:hypothetical protein
MRPSAIVPATFVTLSAVPRSIEPIAVSAAPSELAGSSLPRRTDAFGWRRALVSLVMCLLFLASQASAVVIINPDQTANNGQTSAAGTTAPYDNVGVRGSSSATVVYLGNQWAITDNHVTVTPGDPSFGYVQLFEPSQSQYENVTVDQTKAIFNTDGSPTDLKLVHLTSDPGLPSVNIAPFAPPNNPTTPTPVVMIGAGENLGTQQPYTFGAEGFTGYNLTTSVDLPRWGTNAINNGTVGFYDLHQTNGTSEEFMYGFTTTMASTPTATNQEAQVTPGDSGGGVFEQIGGSWFLVGLIDGLAATPPGSVSSDYLNNVWFTEQSFMADLAPYSSIIAAAMVPEPSSLTLGVIGLATLLAAGWRARQRRA